MTVSTFFPDGDPEDTSVDGHVERAVGSDTWADIRAGAGNQNDDAGTTSTSPVVRADTITDMWDLMTRSILLFDTVSLPDADVISAATLELVLTASQDDFAESIAVVESTPASDIDIVNADYGQVGSTRQASDRTIAGLTVDSSTHNAWTLNATGRASIDQAGVSKFGLRIAADLDNNEPAWASTNLSRITWATAEEVLVDDKRPRLVVTHASGAEPSAVTLAGQQAGASPTRIRTTMVGT